MNSKHLLYYLFVLCLFTIEWSYARRNNEPKKKPTPVKHQPIKLNVDILPPLTDVLQELQFSAYLNNFVRMGVTETRLLLRLSSMDFQIMEMDWPDFTPEKVATLKQKISVLLTMATITEDKSNPDLELRNKQKYGRIYLENGVQSFEFTMASFGGVPPVGKQPIVLSQTLGECNSSHTTNYHGNLVLVLRGNCTFLEKAKNALSNNATGVLIVNTEDKLESFASGVGIDKGVKEEMVAVLNSFPVVCLSNTSWESLSQAIAFQPTLPTYVHVVPLKCRTGGQCLPVLKEEKEVQAEVSWGTMRIRRGKTAKSFEFLTSNFGSNLPVNQELPILFADPIDACSPLKPIEGGKGVFALVAHRGTCRFDIKALHAHQAGARFLIVVDVEDHALQRMGGMHPEVGLVGIPSALVTAEAGRWLETVATSSTDLAWIELFPAPDTRGFDNWLEVAYMNWAEDGTDKVMQLQGMIQKFQDTENRDIVSWLQRRLQELETSPQTEEL